MAADSVNRSGDITRRYTGLLRSYQIYNEFYAFADGYTLAGIVTGAYRMKDGSKQVDQSTAVWIGIDDSREASLRQLVAEICRRLRQEAIYLERTSGTIDFIKSTDTGDPT